MSATKAIKINASTPMVIKLLPKDSLLNKLGLALSILKVRHAIKRQIATKESLMTISISAS